ncbi:MAG: GtrA family protein [Actinomycetales bacterium]|nr:GtrA family protein [Actinomycetales bacterium]
MSERVRRPLAFLGVGAASALVDGGTFSVVYALGAPAAASSAVGFLLAFAVNYSGNRLVVFRVRHQHSMLVRYLVLVAVNLLLATATVAVLVGAGLEAHLAKFASMVLIAGLNYVAMATWVFRAPDGPLAVRGLGEPGSFEAEQDSEAIRPTSWDDSAPGSSSD